MVSSTRAVVFMLLASIFATGTQAAVSCDTIFGKIYPCAPYVMHGGVGPIPSSCCNNIRRLKGVAKSVSDRKVVCGCIKSALAQLPSQHLKIVISLPRKCGVDLPFKIDPSIDCNSIH